MKLEDLQNVCEVLNTNFTIEEANNIFGTDGNRIWSKHWSYHSKKDMIHFNANFSKFNNGAYAHLRGVLDNWLETTIASTVTPLGFKLVKKEEVI